MTRIAMLAGLLLLSACGGGKSDERDTAAGKILTGSISDAMLQTDRLQSEAPLAAPEPANGEARASATGVRTTETAAEPVVAETPEAEGAAPPAAAPAPQPAPAAPPAP